MVTTLTASNATLSDLLADFRASVEAAQQQHASWSASAAKLGRQPSQRSKEAATAGDSSAGQPQVADKTLQDLQGRTEAAAVAAAEQITVVKQLIDLVSNLNRRCNSSNDQLHHLTSAIHQLQLESADLQAQQVTATENQQDAATHVSQVLDISKHLQSCVEGLASELDSERSAKKRLQKQMDAMQRQVLFQGEALRALQSAALNTAGDVEELQQHSKQTSESVSTLLSSKSQLHKQLQKMMLVEQQLSTDIRDTQTVVAGELAAIRKHVQLVNSRTNQACKHQKGQLSSQISNINSRVEELEQQLTMLLTARTAAGAAGGRRGATELPVGRGHSRSGPTHPHPPPQQQRDHQQMMSDLLALLDSEASDLSNDYDRSSQSVAEAARLIADDIIPQTAAAAAAAAAAGPDHHAGSSSTARKKKKKSSKRPPWVFEVLEKPLQQQDHQQQQQQREQVEALTLRKHGTASNSLNRRQMRSSKLAQAVKDRLVAQQQQQLEQQKHDSVHRSAQQQGLEFSRCGPAVKTQVAPRKKRNRWLP